MNSIVTNDMIILSQYMKLRRFYGTEWHNIPKDNSNTDYVLVCIENTCADNVNITEHF